jgi:hypothetical protein
MVAGSQRTSGEASGGGGGADEDQRMNVYVVIEREFDSSGTATHVDHVFSNRHAAEQCAESWTRNNRHGTLEAEIRELELEPSDEDLHADCRGERVWLEDAIRELKAQLAQARAAAERTAKRTTR